MTLRNSIVRVFRQETAASPKLKMTSDKGRTGRQQRPPVDSGWAWVVLAACFVNMLLAVGYLKIFGMVYVRLLSIFKLSHGVTVIVMAVHGAVFSFGGLVTQTVILSFLSIRTTVMLGGVIHSLGIIATVLVNNFALVVLMQSVVAGFACSMIMNPSVTAVCHYFHRRRALATGVTWVGANVGGMVVPPLMEHLLQEYGFRGALLLYGGLALHVVACGALLRPLPAGEEHESGGRPEREDLPKENCRCSQENLALEERDNGSLREREDLPECQSDGKNICPKHQDGTECYPGCRFDFCFPSEDLPQTENVGVTVREEGARGRASEPTVDICEEKTSPGVLGGLSDFDREIVGLSDGEVAGKRSGKSTRTGSGAKLGARLREALDLTLFKDARMSILLAFTVFAVIPSALMNAFLPALAESKGLGSDVGALALTVASAAGLSKLGAGWLADRRPGLAVPLFCLALLTTGLLANLTSLYRQPASLLVYSALYGCAGDLYFALQPVLEVQLLGRARFAKVYGYVQVTEGVGVVAAFFFTGWLRDVSGNFDSVHHFLGACAFVAVTILVLARACGLVGQHHGDE